MVEISVVDPHENDVDCNGSSVGFKESDVEGSRRGCQWQGEYCRWK